MAIEDVPRLTQIPITGGSMSIDLDKRRALRLISCGALAAVSSSGVRAQTAGGKPLRVVVGVPPGSALDSIARVMARRLEVSLASPVVVDNRPGAGAMLAVANVGAAAPDGSTVLLGSIAEFAIAPHIYKKPPFDPGLLVPISETVFGSMVIASSPRVPAKSIGEFLQWARSKSPLMVGTFGPGSPHHLVAVMLGQAAKLNVEPVHYRLQADIISGLVSGDLPVTVTSSALALGWQQAGKATVLAVTGPSRQALFPTVPTFRESGLADAEFAGWVGIFAPPGTPREVADRLSTAMSEVVRIPAVKSDLEALGFQVTGTSRGEFERTIASDRSRFAKIVAASGMKLD
jgi:tripartite-type tricarboxylate transporter receptor subunit TctC